MIELNFIFKHIFNLYPHAIRSLKASTNEINEIYKLNGSKSICIKDLNFYCKRRASFVFILNKKFVNNIDNLLIKVPIDAARKNRWQPENEADRLNNLATIGPKNKSFFYLKPVSASNSKSFFILPYYPSITLRQALETTKATNKSDKIYLYSMNHCIKVGEWLGLSYTQNKCISKNNSLDYIGNTYKNLNYLETNTNINLTNIKIFLTSYTNEKYILKLLSTIFMQPIHGDFIHDNILIGSNGKICFIDPEQISKSHFSDFCRFIDYSIIFSNRKKNKLSIYRSGLKHFLDGIQKTFTHWEILPLIYLNHVVSNLITYRRQVLNKNIKFGILPSKFLYWYDQKLLYKYQINWLKHISKSKESLADIILTQ